MLARTSPLLVVTALFSGACGAPKVGVLKVHGAPADALVTVDDQYVGKLGRLERFGIKVTEGEHRLTVEAPGRFPRDELVKVPANAEATVEVTLTPIPE